MTKRFFPADTLDPIDAYKFAIGLVVPRPIGWIGSISSDGIANLAPFSFFNAVTGYPPTVLFSPGFREGEPKDTLANVDATGEFTVNLVSADIGPQMNKTSASAPADADEFVLAGLTAIIGTEVAAPLVAECKANFECRVTQIVSTGHPDSRGTVVFGEIVAYHIEDSILDGTRINQEALDAIGRMGGPRYTHTRSLFEMDRPD